MLKTNSKPSIYFTQLITIYTGGELSNYCFNFLGGQEETYFIDLKNGEGNAGKGKPADAPDATLTMNNENFQKLFDGIYIWLKYFFFLKNR